MKVIHLVLCLPAFLGLVMSPSNRNPSTNTPRNEGLLPRPVVGQPGSEADPIIPIVQSAREDFRLPGIAVCVFTSEQIVSTVCHGSSGSAPSFRAVDGATAVGQVEGLDTGALDGLGVFLSLHRVAAAPLRPAGRHSSAHRANLEAPPSTHT